MSCSTTDSKEQLFFRAFVLPETSTLKVNGFPASITRSLGAKRFRRLPAVELNGIVLDLL